MIQEEFLHSDHVALGSKVVPYDELKGEFPKWHEALKQVYGEKKMSTYGWVPDYSYGVSATLNAIYSVDFENAIAEYLCSFEYEKNEGGLYYPPIRVENILSFAPLKARQWAYYNLDTCTWRYEDVPSDAMQDEGISVKLRRLVGNRLLHILEGTNVIICMDVATGKLSYFDCLKEIRQKDGTLQSFSSIIAYENSALLFTTAENSVYEIDPRVMKVINVHKIPLNCEGVWQAIPIQGTDWICLLEHANASRIITWNIKTGKAKEITYLSIGPILGFCNDFNGLYLIPQKDNCVVKIDYDNNTANRIELQTEINLQGRKHEFYNRCEYGHSFIILAYNGYSNYFTIFLPYDFSIAEIDLSRGKILNRRKWQVNGIEDLIRKQMKTLTNGIYYENDFFELQGFVDDLREDVGK